jgi:hypothetical protein
MVAAAGTPICTTEMILEAAARVHGNLLLSEGNLYGVRVSAFLAAIAANPFAGATKDRGAETVVAFTDAPPVHIGAAIAGLNGSCNGTLECIDDQSIRVTLTIAEGLPKNLAVPMDVGRSAAVRPMAQAW